MADFTTITASFKQRRKQLRRRQMTAIDVDGQMLRVVQTVHRQGETKVVRFVAEPLDVAVTEPDPTDPVAIGTSIAKALQRLHLNPGPVVMGVPRALVVLRTLWLPASASRRELAAMVHFQIAKDLPFRIEEAVIDFKVHGPIVAANVSESKNRPENAPPETKLAVLVAAAKHEVVEFYRQIAAAAGLNLTALGLRSYANARCVEACQLTASGESVALISLRPDEVIIDVLLDHSLVFSRVASVKHLAEASAPAPSEPPPAQGASSSASEAAAAPPGLPEEEATFAEAVTIEVVRSLHSYEGTLQHGQVGKIVVAGGTGDEPAVIAALQKRLAVPCTLLDPASALGLPESTREHAPGAIVAFGLGLGVNDPEGLPFDFLHPKQPKAPLNIRRIKIVAGAAAAAVLLFVLVGVRSRLVGQRLHVRDQLALQLRDEEKKRPIYRRLRAQTLQVQQWLEENQTWLDHYAYLSAVLPTNADLYVTTLATGSRDNIRLSVQARSGDILTKVDSQLRAAGYEVKPLAITPSPDKYGYQFKSTIELVLPPQMRIDLSKSPPQLVRDAPKVKTKPPATPPAPARPKGGK